MEIVLLLLFLLKDEKKEYLLMSAKNSSERSVNSPVQEEVFEDMDSCYKESVNRNQAGARYFWCQKEEK